MTLPRQIASASAALVLAAALGSSVPARAFHSGGVGNCGGCHTLHISSMGLATFDRPHPADVCLNCHQTGTGNTWGLDPALPGPQYGGGPFVFLAEDNLGDGPADGIVPGHAAGHNVVSLANGTVADPRHGTGPGGSFPSSALACTSCHDPHGKGATFRLLRGAGTVISNGQSYPFTNAAPQGEGASLEQPESPTNHSAYRAGVSDWCANCHASYLDNHGSASGSPFRHPVNVPIGATVAATYNAYQGTGQPGGAGLGASIPEVALESATATPSGSGMVDASARITCLSCHRAHASSAPAAGRWDFHITTWAEEGVKSGSFRLPNPYPAAGLAQRQLCDKCHGDGTTPSGAPPPAPAPMLSPPVPSP